MKIVELRYRIEKTMTSVP